MREKKPVGKGQIVLLLFLLWLSYHECWPDFESLVFPSIFLLTLWGIARKRRFLPQTWIVRLSERLKPKTLRLRALHIRLIRGKKDAPFCEDPCTCLNCGEHYTGNFCPRCGQSRKTARYRLRNALQNIAGGFFNIDTGFGRTLIDLLHRPGYMIADFIGGKRAPQFRPFQTLFILAALYIMAVQLVDPDALTRQESEESPATRQEQLDYARKEIERQMSQSGDSATIAGLQMVEHLIEQRFEKQQRQDTLLYAEPDEYDNESISGLIRLKQAVTSNIERRLADSPFLARVWGLLKSWAHGNKAFRIIATLPLFALASLLVFFRRRFRPRYNLTEHIFVQAYIACQTLLISIIVLPFNGHAEVDDLYEVPLWFIFCLFWVDYKQLFRLSWWSGFWNTWFMLLYAVLILLLLAILIVALIAGASAWVLA